MKFTKEQKKEITRFFSNEVSVDLFEPDLDKLESLIFNNESIPIEPLKPACEQCKKFEGCEIRKLVWFDIDYPKPLCEFYCGEFESK